MGAVELPDEFQPAVLGWQAKVPLDLAFLFVPFGAMTLASFSTSSWFYIYCAGRWFADVEEKMFRISGLPLLTHETELLYQRKRRKSWKWLFDLTP